MAVPVQLIINIVSQALALFLIYWAKEGNFREQVKQLFGETKLRTSEEQADHLADITFYYASFALLTSTTINLIRFLQRRINQALQPDSPFVESLNQTIRRSFEQLVIFGTIYIYLVMNDGFGTKPRKLMVLPFLFLVGRLGSFVEQMLSQAFSGRYKFTFFGLIMTVVPVVMMLSKIANVRVIEW